MSDELLLDSGHAIQAPRFLKCEDVARQMQMSPGAVRKAVERGSIPSVTVTPRVRRVPAVWVERLLAEAGFDPDPDPPAVMAQAA